MGGFHRQGEHDEVPLPVVLAQRPDGDPGVHRQGHNESDEELRAAVHAYRDMVAVAEGRIPHGDWDAWHELQTLVSNFDSLLWSELSIAQAHEHVVLLLRFVAQQRLLE